MKNFARRDILNEGTLSSCVLCGEEDEDANHVLIKCGIAFNVWMLHASWSKALTAIHEHWFNILHPCWTTVKKKMKEIWVVTSAAVIWSLWLRHNALLFREQVLSEADVFDLARI
ncbi:hypothetical protein Ancab_026530 [Ancistrocladus abbreviatus]